MRLTSLTNNSRNSHYIRGLVDSIVQMCVRRLIVLECIVTSMCTYTYVRKLQ